jgi:hypothetical protein
MVCRERFKLEVHCDRKLSCSLQPIILSRGWRRICNTHGAPGEIRTPDLLLRRQSLYPSELRAHKLKSTCGGGEASM